LKIKLHILNVLLTVARRCLISSHNEHKSQKQTCPLCSFAEIDYATVLSLSGNWSKNKEENIKPSDSV